MLFPCIPKAGPWVLQWDRRYGWPPTTNCCSLVPKGGGIDVCTLYIDCYVYIYISKYSIHNNIIPAKRMCCTPYNYNLAPETNFLTGTNHPSMVFKFSSEDDYGMLGQRAALVEGTFLLKSNSQKFIKYVSFKLEESSQNSALGLSNRWTSESNPDLDQSSSSFTFLSWWFQVSLFFFLATDPKGACLFSLFRAFFSVTCCSTCFGILKCPKLTFARFFGCLMGRWKIIEGRHKSICRWRWYRNLLLSSPPRSEDRIPHK